VGATGINQPTNFRGINEFKRGYQPISNLMKDENGDLLVDSHTF
jgi:hypothetical protein